MSGCLYIVATPIGNLGDITFRALEILKNVDIILCEDTRHSKKLLTHYNISTTLQSFHEYNEKHLVKEIITQLQTKHIALISDAGTPLISDPGYHLVNTAKKNNINVIPIPGTSSVIAALSVSGMPTHAFNFIGFLPTKSAAKYECVRTIDTKHTTTICFESPRRIIETLNIMQEVFEQNRQICLAKELTKSYERIITGSVVEILQFLQQDINHTKGEFVVIVAPNENTDNNYQDLPKILNILDKELPKSKSAKVAAKLTGISKSQCYDMLMKM